MEDGDALALLSELVYFIVHILVTVDSVVPEVGQPVLLLFLLLPPRLLALLLLFEPLSRSLEHRSVWIGAGGNYSLS